MSPEMRSAHLVSIPKHSFDPRKLSEEEYNKALELYEKVFKNYKNHKGFVNPGAASIYTKAPTIFPYSFSFVINGQRMVSEGYLRNVQKVDEKDTSITENDQKVAVIYLMTRYNLFTSSLDRKRVEFRQALVDVNALAGYGASQGYYC